MTLFMKKLLIGISSPLVLFLVYSLWNWDSSPPTVQWREAPSVIGMDSQISLEIQDQGKGLQWLEVAWVRSGDRHVVVSETYEAPWSWQQGMTQRSLDLSVGSSLPESILSEGEFLLEVRVRDQSDLWFWENEVFEQRSFNLDLTPPRIQTLSDQHYIRQGGSEAILYKVSEDTVASGVQVGEHLFRGYPLPGRGQGTHVCLFALAHDQAPATAMYVWAEDAAGNRNQTSFWKRAFPVKFRKRNIQLSESMINAVVPEILAHTDMTLGESVLETFLEINGRLREINHRQIEEISRQSVGHLLWSGAFLQLSNSQVESAFADHRTYYYKSQKVDQQTHLGFDLATVAHGAVESANDGIVVFADYLGIYGNTVLVDHGLGLISLYGHLSSIEVQEGQGITKGAILGRTGQTGLAAGDHLHFSMILQGVQVNPLEWWDERWVDQHILGKALVATEEGEESRRGAADLFDPS
ncbi:MAG: M23 family metallopeptidase [Acidobacteria bacterium]|nr:MAG: M23 family metallopeptidase [Acidobacteriota bacterium]